MKRVLPLFYYGIYNKNYTMLIDYADHTYKYNEYGARSFSVSRWSKEYIMWSTYYIDDNRAGNYWYIKNNNRVEYYSHPKTNSNIWGYEVYWQKLDLLKNMYKYYDYDKVPLTKHITKWVNSKITELTNSSIYISYTVNDIDKILDTNYIKKQTMVLGIEKITEINISEDTKALKTHKRVNSNTFSKIFEDYNDIVIKNLSTINNFSPLKYVKGLDAPMFNMVDIMNKQKDQKSLSSIPDKIGILKKPTQPNGCVLVIVQQSLANYMSKIVTDEIGQYNTSNNTRITSPGRQGTYQILYKSNKHNHDNTIPQNKVTTHILQLQELEKDLIICRDDIFYRVKWLNNGTITIEAYSFQHTDFVFNRTEKYGYLNSLFTNDYLYGPADIEDNKLDIVLVYALYD